MTAREALHLRPGLALGERPERSEPGAGAKSAGVPLLDAWRRRRTADRFARRAPTVAAEVRRRAEDLAGLDDPELAARSGALRDRLLVAGLGDALLPDTLALVSEVSVRTLGQRPYDEQLQGAWMMASGALVEMETGEGKTLATALAAACVALSGVPVHVMSANDYLVTRDAEAARTLCTRLGIEVSAVVEGASESERRRAYRADVTYGTGKQIAFDYLRDRLERAPGGSEGCAPRLRGLCFALVDEADSVLVDEASTPLVLSRASAGGDEVRIFKRALRLARTLEAQVDYTVDPRRRALTLTEAGRKRLAELAASLGGPWRGPLRREEWVERALCALHLYRRDRDYLVRDGGIQIVDALSGRVSPDRSWGQGLHQLVELKEGCVPTPRSETLARLAYQSFFRRYLRLAGTTGTAREVARELGRVYGLVCVRVPTRRPSRRRDGGTRLLAGQDEKWEWVTARTAELHRAGRAVLIGTASVEASERLAERLGRASLPHRVLNARQDAEEAEIVAQAGRPGAVTVATAMAGRGTDIALTAELAEAGGLHVIATERAASARVDRQLAGRCARQGDPGSHEMVASLEDPPLAAYYPGWLLRALATNRRLARKLRQRLANLLLRLPQRAEERRLERARSALAKVEEELGALLGFAGTAE